MIKKSVLRKFEKGTLCFLLTGFLLLTLLVNIPFESKAAQSYFAFPCLIGIPDMYNGEITDSMVATVRQGYLDLLLYSYNNDVSSNYVIICSHSNNSTTYTFSCFNIPQLELDYDELTYKNQGQHYVQYIYDTSDSSWQGPSFYGGWVNSWTTQTRDLFLYGNGWVVDTAWPELYAEDLTSQTYQSILVWTDDPTLVNPGSPDVTPVPNNPNLDNPVIDNPTPPSPPTMPQHDPNLSDIENIGNWFSWLGYLITYNFTNLLTNLKTFLGNLFTNLKSWLTTIKDVIYNGFKNVIDNFTTLFKPIIDKISSFIDQVKVITDHIIDIGTVDGDFSIANILKYLFIPDIADLVDLVEDNDTFHVFGFVTALKTFLTYLKNTLFNLDYIYSLHVPSCVYHGKEIGDFDISFAWFIPYKTYTDLVISAFLVLGYIYWIVVSLAGIIRGNSSVIKDMSPSDSRD